jgi:di/tricarboxylate transporter
MHLLAREQRDAGGPGETVQSKWIRSTGGWLVGGVAVLLTLPLPPGISAEAVRVGVLTLFAIACWATRILPEQVTALAFFFLAMLFSLASPDVVFSGFQSTALWLVFSGLVIGVAMQRTGLGEWVAQTMTGLFGTSYVSLISGLVLIGIALTFVMPSTIGRTLLLIPIVSAIAARCGFAKCSPGHTGVVMAAAVGTYMPAAAVLPANVPNLALAGIAETLYGLPLQYGSYLVWHMPVTGLLKAIAMVMVICWLFPATMPPSERVHATLPMTPEQKRLVGLLLAALGLWMSDAFHHISPAWIGLGVALVCLLPGVDLVPLTAFNGQINLSPLLYLAGILGMGAMVAQSGLGDLLARILLGIISIEPGQHVANFATLVGVSTLLSMLTTTAGVPAVFSPFAAELAKAADWPLLTVLMTQVIGYSTVILPYQAPPLVLAVQLGGVPPATAVRFMLMLAAVTLIVLAPLNYLWWQALGNFG